MKNDGGSRGGFANVHAGVTNLRRTCYGMDGQLVGFGLEKGFSVGRPRKVKASKWKKKWTVPLGQWPNRLGLGACLIRPVHRRGRIRTRHSVVSNTGGAIVNGIKGSVFLHRF